MPGLLVLLISYLGCDINLVLVVWFLAVTLITASYAGAMANIVDIAPNFAGPVLAFAQTIHMSASFLSPLAAFQLLNGQETLMSAWRTVFYVTAFVAVSTYVMYQICGTADVSIIIIEINGDITTSLSYLYIERYSHYTLDYHRH